MLIFSNHLVHLAEISNYCVKDTALTEFKINQTQGKDPVAAEMVSNNFHFTI
jgi:hypothetical protein